MGCIANHSAATMSVRVFLDKSHAHFTNLDIITGKVSLNLLVDTPIASINVKLEGESRTRLAGPKYPNSERTDKKRSETETHKLLYKVATVFPGIELRTRADPNAYYSLAAGTYEYPFQFKFPFNNDCVNNQLATNLNMAGLRLEVARDGYRHVKKTLPPSISGFPGEAEIRYYVKATVVRPQFYKENYRAFADFKFLPIEPPRKKDTDKESFARRQHQFSNVALNAVPEKKGLFRKASYPPPQIDTNVIPPRFSVDARLPNPPIVTCNEPLPLRVLVKKLSDSSETIYLQLLQVELIGYTKVRANDLTRVESGSWVIATRSNMNMPLGNAGDPVGKEWKVDSRMWNQVPLPNSVAPTFDTCNISRTYELEVRVGLTHGSPGAVKPELIVLPLRLAVQVYSGMAPPPALLEAMGFSGEEAGGVSTSPPAPHPPPRPSAPAYPAPPPNPEEYEDAPPSYEDAMAEALGPVDGPRREYNPPDAVSGNMSQTGTDSKGSVGNSKDSERLFPNSGPLNASTDSFDTYPASPVDGSSSSKLPGYPSSPTSENRASPQPQADILATSLSPMSYEPISPSRTGSSGNLQPEQPQRRASPFLGIPSRKPVPGSKGTSP